VKLLRTRVSIIAVSATPLAECRMTDMQEGEDGLENPSINVPI